MRQRGNFAFLEVGEGGRKGAVYLPVLYLLCVLFTGTDHIRSISSEVLNKLVQPGHPPRAKQEEMHCSTKAGLLSFCCADAL
jgi:hypothetical protein